MPRRRLVPVLLLAAGCGDPPVDDGTGALGLCPEYLACLEAVDDPRLDDARATYGDGGTCWTSSIEEQTDECTESCDFLMRDVQDQNRRVDACGAAYFPADQGTWVATGATLGDDPCVAVEDDPGPLGGVRTSFELVYGKAPAFRLRNDQGGFVMQCEARDDGRSADCELDGALGFDARFVRWVVTFDSRTEARVSQEARLVTQTGDCPLTGSFSLAVR